MNSEKKEMRISLAAKKLNIGITTIVEKLANKGHRIDNNPNSKLNFEQLKILAIEFNNASLLDDNGATSPIQRPRYEFSDNDILYFRDQPKSEEGKFEEPFEVANLIGVETISTDRKLQGPIVTGKIDLDKKPKLEEEKAYKTALELIKKYKRSGQMASLNLSGIGLNKIPNEVSSLNTLKKLYLNNNEITEIENLPQNINEIELNNNRIKKLKNIPNKVSIAKLNYNLISSVENLPNSIQILELSNNQIEVINDLPSSLKRLRMNFNKIDDINIPNHLEHLSITHNKLNNIPDIEKHKKLTELYLFNNAINGFRPEIFGDNDNYNCLKGLKSYLHELERKVEINRNIKLVLVGNSNVGKSSILRLLKNLDYDPNIKSTHGIALDKFEHPHITNPINFQVWDLGGQEIYYGTHRIFMMSPAVQIVVFDSMTEEQSVSSDRIKGDEFVRNISLPFYISRIEELSPESKIIIVQNKTDLNHNINANVRRIKDKYLILPISVEKSIRINTLKSLIYDEAKDLSVYGMKVPYYWERIREYFANILQQEFETRQKTILKEEFIRICEREKVFEEGIDDLLVYLHNTGACYYKKELGERIIIDQIWALKVIYNIFDKESTFYVEMRDRSNGKCTVRTLFKDFDRTNHPYTIEDKWMFLDFMRSCGLCFPIKQDPNEIDTLDTFYVFPEFLQTNKADVIRLWELKNTKKQVWRKKFEFLPFYPLHTFISSYGCKTPFNLIWRNGILIYTDTESFAGFLIEANFDENYLTVTIDEEIADWFDAIRDSIIVHGDTYKYEWELQQGAHIPITSPKTVNDLENLTDFKQNLHLDGLNIPREGKLVISYAQEDFKEVELLCEFLDGQKISYWFDKKLSNRQSWDEEINTEFVNATGFVIVLSHSYMHSRKEFIHSTETPIILEALKKGKFATIITVRPFDLKAIHPIYKINIFEKGKVMPPIEEYNNACDYINRFIRDLQRKF